MLADGRVLLAGGNNATGFLDSAEVYDPTTNVFSPVGSMTSVRTNAVAAALPGGRALVAGGRDDDPILASAESLRSGHEQFQRRRNRLDECSERVAAVAAPLPDGRVLVAGGTNATHRRPWRPPRSSIPKTNAFSSAGIGAMGTARTGCLRRTARPTGGCSSRAGRTERRTCQSAEIYAADANTGVSNAFSGVVRGRKLIVSVQASGQGLSQRRRLAAQRLGAREAAGCC